MQLLQDLYDKHKELLDQTKLTQDLERLQMYTLLYRAFEHPIDI